MEVIVMQEVRKSDTNTYKYQQRFILKPTLSEQSHNEKV